MPQPLRSPRPLRVEQLEDRLTPSAALDRLVVTLAPTGPTVLPAATGFASSVTSLGAGVYRVDVAPGTDLAAAAAEYAAKPGVLSAAPDQLVAPARTPNDPSFAAQSGLTQVSAPAAWDRQTGTRGTIVAVLDTGVDVRHPDLYQNLWVNPWEIAGNGKDDDNDGFIDDVNGVNFIANTGDPTDADGHGTHVAGIIGAVGNNGVGTAGVNWNTRIMPLKFIGPAGGYVSDAVRGINFAVAHGAKVISASWGGDVYDAGLQAAITSARTSGVIFVAAAGNNGRNTDASPFYPASYTTTSDNVVGVAAAESNGSLAGFSNRGSAVTLAAPGVNITSTLPNGRYGALSGTSMATPFVAGAISLIWDEHPTWGYQQVIAKLKASVDPLPALAGQVATGGRLNVAKALDATPPPTPPAPPPTPGDTTGPRVTSAGFAGATGGYDRARLTFSETLDPATFTLADIGVRGPAGTVAATAVTAVSGTNNAQFDVTFPRQTAAGAYTLTVGEDVRDAAGNQMDQDRNGANGQVPADRHTLTATLGATSPPVPPAPSTRTAVAAGNVPIAVPDRGSTRGLVNVAQDITIADLDVTVTVTHPTVGNLFLTLTGPTGRTTTLVNRRGGSGDNFATTTFDDAAGTAITSAAAPYSGRFRPEGALAAFNGTNARGTWTLTVADQVAGEVGRLTGVTLSFAAATRGAGASVGGVFGSDAAPDAVADGLRPETRRLIGRVVMP